ncbi:hypothetical protein GOBAR_DD05114 [Gossypium barbadense]|nr:hypothetical protein GOBAR_DD05114 [Gossypium barbadense]
MGTRQPLILQMVHYRSTLEPRCRFQEEDSKEYKSPVVLASTIADAIKSRTEALLKKTKTSVSPKPIVMRAEFAHCPNLTIIDTPGFDQKAYYDNQGYCWLSLLETSDSQLPSSNLFFIHKKFSRQILPVP